MSDELVWEQPPVREDSGTEFGNKIRRIADQLKARPDQWARVTDYYSTAIKEGKDGAHEVERHRMAFKNGFYRGINAGEFQFKRVTRDGKVAGWCRYLTEESRERVYGDKQAREARDR